MADTPDPEVILRHGVEDEMHDHEEIGQGDTSAVEEEREVFQDANEDRDPRLVRPMRPYMGFVGFGKVHGRNAGLPMKPEPYNGTEDWEEYISHFQLCSELGRWNEDEKMFALAASLKGPARTFYISLFEEEKGSYRNLVRQLSQRFGSTRQQSRWLSRLEDRLRKPDETIAALADDLRQMSQRAYPNLDGQAQEVLALNQLYKSITLEMKCRCIDRNCTTIAQAVDVIERYEAILGDSHEKKKAVRAVTEGAKKSGDHAEKEVVNTLRDVVSSLERIQRQQAFWHQRQGFPRPQGKYGRLCVNCNSPDHIKRNCPHLRVTDDRGTGGMNQYNSQTSGHGREQENSIPSSH